MSITQIITSNRGKVVDDQSFAPCCGQHPEVRHYKVRGSKIPDIGVFCRNNRCPNYEPGMMASSTYGETNEDAHRKWSKMVATLSEDKCVVCHMGLSAGVVVSPIITPEKVEVFACISHREMVASFPRRSCVQRMTPAEFAIRAALLAVEVTGCDARLTDAVNLLHLAAAKVGDFVDGVESPKPQKDELHLSDGSIRGAITGHLRAIGYQVEADSLRIYGYGTAGALSLSEFQGHIRITGRPGEAAADQ